MADFDESKHPRAKDGKFTNGTGNRGYDSSDDFRQTVERAKSASSKNTEIHRTQSKQFHDAIKSAKDSLPLDTRWRVDVHEEDDYKNKGKNK